MRNGDCLDEVVKAAGESNVMMVLGSKVMMD